MRISLLILASVALPLAAQLPDKAVKLKDSYTQAVERATLPLRKTYLTELEQLKSEYTRSANLQAALAIDEEIRALTPVKTEGAIEPTQEDARKLTKRQLEKLILEGKWVLGQKLATSDAQFNEDSNLWTFHADGYCQGTGGQGHKWKMQPDGAIKLFTEAYESWGILLTRGVNGDWTAKHEGKSWPPNYFAVFKPATK